MTGKKFLSVSFLKVGLHMHTVPQNKDRFTINDLFYCCKALIFTQPLVYEFLRGLIFMAHPVLLLPSLVGSQQNLASQQAIATALDVCAHT